MCEQHETKICSRCRVAKELSAFYFHITKNKYRAACKECTNAINSAKKIRRGRKLSTFDIDGSTYKTCSKCKITKEISQFYIISSTGRPQSSCKDCHKTKHKATYKKKEYDFHNIRSVFVYNDVLCKKCVKCEKILSLAHFSKRTTNDIDGFRSTCRNCESIYRKSIRVKKGPNRRQVPDTYMPLEYKQCSRCKKVKHLDSFSKNKYHITKKGIYCKDCEKSRRALKRNLIVSNRVYEKLCKRCNTVKTSKDFPKCSKNTDGLYTYCKTCKILENKRNPNRKTTTTNISEKLYPSYINKLLKSKGIIKPTKEMQDIQLLSTMLRREARKQRKEANANN